MNNQILKSVFISALLSLSVTLCFAQAPQSFSYQAVARDVAGNIVANQAVSLRFSILDGSASGTLVYQETQNAVTNVLGLCNVSVGQGTVTSGTFSAINWGGGSKFLRVEIDPTGGSSYTVMGTTQMLSVPYALYASNGGTTYSAGSGIGLSGTTFSNNAVTDATLSGNGTATTPLKIASQGATNGQVLKYNGTSWVPGTDNDAQTLSINGNQLSISNGNSVTLPSGGGGSLSLVTASLTGDRTLNSATFTNLPGVSVTFTPTVNQVFVQFTASGVGSPSSISAVDFQVLVNGTPVGGTLEKVGIVTFDDFLFSSYYTTGWSSAYSKVITVNPNVSNTVTVQYLTESVYGSANVYIQAASDVSEHATLTVFNQ